VIKRYYAPTRPYERALAHPELAKSVKRRLREVYRSLDPIALLAEIRAAQPELGERVDRRARATPAETKSSMLDTIGFARALGKTVEAGEQRTIHQRRYIRRKLRGRTPSMLDPHVAMIEGWLATEPQLPRSLFLARLAERFPGQFGKPQHGIVARSLRAEGAADQGGRTADRWLATTNVFSSRRVRYVTPIWTSHVLRRFVGAVFHALSSAWDQSAHDR
jgi:hypothetical protein